jgi:D-tyrosyl-tRNA(Tyr) deacylase
LRAVVQRVSRASVRVGGRLTGEIAAGLLVFVGVGVEDEERDADWLAQKIAGLRIFRDDDGLMNRCVVDVDGAVLLVSQFTLYGDARRGRRPSFAAAAREPAARLLFERVGAATSARGLRVAYGAFGATMDVELINQGPVTLLLDSRGTF